MTLSYSTRWPDKMGELAGQPTYFTNKIMKSMWIHYPELTSNFVFDRSDEEKKRFEEIDPFEDLTVHETKNLIPKLHTIRRGQRWKKGMKIHMVINNRTEKRFQFTPVLECTGVQDVEIKFTNPGFYHPTWVDGELLNIHSLKKLAVNNGFLYVDDFFRFFNSYFSGQIVHWTDIRY